MLDEVPTAPPLPDAELPIVSTVPPQAIGAPVKAIIRKDLGLIERNLTRPGSNLHDRPRSRPRSILQSVRGPPLLTEVVCRQSTATEQPIEALPLDARVRCCRRDIAP